MTETPSNEVLDVKIDSLRALVDAHNDDVKQGFILVRDDISKLRDDIRNQNTNAQEAVKTALDQHSKLHDAHQQEHASADNRFWAAVTVLSGAILALVGFLVYKGDFSNMIGYAGVGGAVFGFVLFFQHKVAFGIGVIGAYAYRTKTGARVINWMIQRTWK